MDTSTLQQAAGGAGGLQGLVVLIAKLSLSTAQRSRLMAAILIAVMIVPLSMPAVKAILAAAQSYTEYMSKLGKAEKQRLPIGLPQLHRWNAVVSHYKQHGGEHVRKACQDYCESIAKAGAAEQQRHRVESEVIVFQLSKCFQKEHKKLEANFRVGSESEALFNGFIKPAMVAEGAVVKQGVAPAGDLELRIQEQLEAISL